MSVEIQGYINGILKATSYIEINKTVSFSLQKTGSWEKSLWNETGMIMSSYYTEYSKDTRGDWS